MCPNNASDCVCLTHTCLFDRHSVPIMRVIVGVVPIIRADTVDAGVEQAGVQEVYIGLPGLVLLVQHCDTMCVAVLGAVGGRLFDTHTTCLIPGNPANASKTKMSSTLMNKLTLACAALLSSPGCCQPPTSPLTRARNLPKFRPSPSQPRNWNW